MKFETLKYLYDIQCAADLLSDFTRGKTFAHYEANALLRSAVERQFGIIEEAMAQLAKIDEPTVSGISHYQHIIAFRNVLIHGDAEVDNRLVWNVIETNLPTLVREVNAFLRG